MIILVFSDALLSSCRDEIEVFQIARIPTFSFANDNMLTQLADKVNINSVGCFPEAVEAIK